MKLVLTTHQFLPEYSSGTELIVCLPKNSSAPLTSPSSSRGSG